MSPSSSPAWLLLLLFFLVSPENGNLCWHVGGIPWLTMVARICFIISSPLDLPSVFKLRVGIILIHSLHDSRWIFFNRNWSTVLLPPLWRSPQTIRNVFFCFLLFVWFWFLFLFVFVLHSKPKPNSLKSLCCQGCLRPHSSPHSPWFSVLYVGWCCTSSNVLCLLQPQSLDNAVPSASTISPS